MLIKDLLVLVRNYHVGDRHQGTVPIFACIMDIDGKNMENLTETLATIAILKKGQVFFVRS